MKQDLIINDDNMCLLTWQRNKLVTIKTLQTLEHFTPQKGKLNVYVNVSKQSFFSGVLPQCSYWDQHQILIKKLMFLSRSEEGVGGKRLQFRQFNGVHIEGFDSIQYNVEQLIKKYQTISGIYSIPLEIPQIISMVNSSNCYLLFYRVETFFLKMIYVNDQKTKYTRIIPVKDYLSIATFKNEVKAAINFLKRHFALDNKLDILIFRDKNMENWEWQSMFTQDGYFQISNPYHENFEYYCIRLFHKRRVSRAKIRSKALQEVSRQQLIMRIKMSLILFGVSFFLFFNLMQSYEIYNLNKALSQFFKPPIHINENSLTSVKQMQDFLRIHKAKLNPLFYLSKLALKRNGSILFDQVSWSYPLSFNNKTQECKLMLKFKSHSKQIKELNTYLKNNFFDFYSQTEEVNKTFQWHMNEENESHFQDYTLLMKKRVHED